MFSRILAKAAHKQSIVLDSPSSLWFNARLSDGSICRRPLFEPPRCLLEIQACDDALVLRLGSNPVAVYYSAIELKGLET